MFLAKDEKNSEPLHLDKREDGTASPSDSDLARTEDARETGPPLLQVDKQTERRLLRKLDSRIVPMVMWMYLMCFMDRVIIGNARLYGMEDDLGLEGNQFQLSVSILFVTYCLFEVPSNMIIRKTNPSYYLAILTILWGLVATFSAMVQGLPGLIACRLLLGLFEAGFFPGVVIYLSLFYNKGSIALRMGYFFSASAISSAVGGLLSYGIGQGMDGTAGWKAWRWIILINGLMTVATGFVVPFILPGSIKGAKFLNDQDRLDMDTLRSAELGQTVSGQKLNRKDVMDAVKDWKTYAFGFCQFCSNLALYSFSVFLPTVISEIGTWSVAQSQALTVPVFALGALVYVAVCRLSDWTQIRGPFIVGFQMVVVVGYIMLVSDSGGGVSLAGTFFVGAGIYVINGLAVAWVVTNSPRYGKRAFASGTQLSMGNAAGVAAPFLFSEGTRPAYTPGYSTAIGVTVFSMALFSSLFCWFAWQNRQRAAGKQDWKIDGKTEEEAAEMGDVNPNYRYTV
ncbi:uncharacterized protein LTR77_008049 [Saxophila tyrrhenica]|uniref:Major facilitator superfamily (MFS) profile domain-containing protein n=1 Tax=Saxophila tyrrhenica TaxID=1690608 RepID=A0AAV9P5H4_9PEZI|nr:hypothetical protein LTR77_008049 [Saxophila tyrrhenica]